jgi:hypothetical protein
MDRDSAKSRDRRKKEKERRKMIERLNRKECETCWNKRR